MTMKLELLPLTLYLLEAVSRVLHLYYLLFMVEIWIESYISVFLRIDQINLLSYSRTPLIRAGLHSNMSELIN